MTEIESKVYNEAYRQVEYFGTFLRNPGESLTCRYSEVASKLLKDGIPEDSVKRAVRSLANAGRIKIVRIIHLHDDLGRFLYLEDGSKATNAVLTLSQADLDAIEATRAKKERVRREHIISIKTLS